MKRNWYITINFVCTGGITMTKSYGAVFRGYRMDANKDTLPEYAGLFIAYRCILDQQSKKVELKEILYIGKAVNVRQTVRELRHKFMAELKEGEDLCYSYAEIPEENIDIIENALLFAQKPRLNEDEKLTREYLYPKPANFLVEGSCALLKHVNFTIK